MYRLLLILALAGAAGGAPVQATDAAPKRVVVIPIRDEIAEPTAYILRRGLKEAEADGADVVLDLKTPGGALDVTLEMIEALEHFRGRTIAYVDNEAMSAGAFVSAVTGEIWFAPDGVIGAAAPVLSTGQDVDATMKQKLVSYLKARMRAISEGKGYRGEVVSAMIDADSELKIDGKVLKEKGELLSLTATEAMHPYGTPPKPLLGAGIAANLDDLLAQAFGKRGFVVDRFSETWSERLAVSINRASPILLGLGFLAVFVGFKAPGMGGFIAIGVALLGVVFLGGHIAGFSGREPVLVFAIGVVLLLLELIFFHSAGFLGIVGALLMMGSLFWSMADLWPNEPVGAAWSADAFARPLANLGSGLLLAGILASALLRFLPRGWIWGRLIVHATVGGAAQASSVEPSSALLLDALVGREGVAATALRPAGQVEIDGRRFEARLGFGAVDAGTRIVVRGRSDFDLLVEEERG